MILLTLEEARRVPLTAKIVCMCGNEDLVDLEGEEQGERYVWKVKEHECTRCGAQLTNTVALMCDLIQGD